MQDGQPLRVLIADDNRDAADSLATLLRLWGHSVRVAYDGQGAITLAEDFLPHVALLDFNMPLMHGGEVAHLFRLRPEFRAMKIYATTANDPERIGGWGLYFDAHFVKPYNLTQLEELLARGIRCDL